MLLGLAYRILGSRAEAEDVVQDTWIAWEKANHQQIVKPRAWLTTACTRKALDVLKSARLSRTNYVGAWLPEPLQTSHLDDPEADHLLAESLTTAFMLVLERLAPKERAAFLLHDVFALGYGEISDGLNISEAACRKLVSRARANVQLSRSIGMPDSERQQALVQAFETAIKTGGTDDLAAMLSKDAKLCADSNGKVVAIREPLSGLEAVLSFISRILHPAWSSLRIIETEINAGYGLLLMQDDVMEAALTFGFDKDGQVSDIYIMRNPDKLSALSAAD